MKMLRLCVVMLTVLLFSVALAEQSMREATVTEVSGKVEAKKAQGEWVAATVGMKLTQGDFVRTMENSRAMLSVAGYAETATIELKPSSQLLLSRLLEDTKEGTQDTLVDLALGQILVKAEKLHDEKSKFEVKTPTSIVGVRGTTFSVAVDALK